MASSMSQYTEEQLRYLADAPARLRQLTADAEPPANIASVNINRLYRALNEMYRQAMVYYQDRDIEHAYQLFFRFSVVVVNILPKHPDFRIAGDEQEKRRCTERVQKAVQNCEDLKEMIRRNYERQAREADEELRVLEVARFRAKQQAEQRAAQEAARREAEERSRKEASAKDDLLSNFDPIKKALPPATGAHAPPPANFSGPVDIGAYSQTTGREGGGLIDYPLSSVPSVNRGTKPTAPVRQSTGEFFGSLFSGGELRHIVVPTTLLEQFLRKAALNTSKSVETCGVLCGKLTENSFVLTHCLIPKQHGGPDSCDTLSEHLVFEYQDKHDLLTLGWIHTHPTQTAFLSSVDLHTHYSYQALLPEAIAIVCSPKFNEIGIFRLNDAGMRAIGTCKLSGHHPHDPCFEKCQHYSFDNGASFTLHDFRD